MQEKKNIMQIHKKIETKLKLDSLTTAPNLIVVISRANQKNSSVDRLT